MEIPEHPGRMVDGKTNEEFIKSIGVTTKECIETSKESGREIPKTKGKLYFD